MSKISNLPAATDVTSEIEVKVTKPKSIKNKKTTNKHNGFTSTKTYLESGTSHTVTITKVELRNILRSSVRNEDLYDDEPVLDPTYLSGSLNAIRRHAMRVGQMPVVEDFIKYLEEVNQDILRRVKNITESGEITFSLLNQYLLCDQEVAIDAGPGIVQGAKIISSETVSNFFGTSLRVEYEYITTHGESFHTQSAKIDIPYFDGVKALNDLPVRLIDTSTRDQLTARGKKYVNFAQGAKYLHYSGQMLVKKWWKWDLMRAHGRMMSDIQTFKQFSRDYYDDERPSSSFLVVPYDSLWMTDAYICGFSFVTKEWGKFIVDNISEIKFNDNAFEQLVMDKNTKDLVKALVTYSSNGFEDIISGKGGGCILLLHGVPGTGKTLTAEAIAELLRKPLYRVSVGNLGTNPEDLEKKLREVLDVAQVWDAVILLDEADIFLEKRGEDVNRSAMTSVFLQLTEYYQGVMFLTTNRVQTFDSAFYSRISVALKYEPLTEAARIDIWKTLLTAASISISENSIKSLAEIEINGRQIKNSIRQAQSLALSEKVKPNFDHIMRVVNLSKKFLEEIT